MENPSQQHIRIEVSDGASIPDPKDRRIVTAWSISIFGAITSLILLCLLKSDPFWNMLQFVSDGVIVTFQVTIFSILLAIPIGMVTGLGRLSQVRAINLVASTYVEVIRGIPLLVQLFFIYYGLGRFFGVGGIPAAVIAMSFCYGAYMGEVFRAGISAINKGQAEAARSLGFNQSQTMRLVIMPQAWRTILPPIGNEFIAMLKDTSLVSILAVADIMRRGTEYAGQYFNYFEAFTLVALVYLIITLILSKGVSIMEARLNYYDR
ncbi:MAG: amino acid ABC transporter permease [Deltaproteobacteria bacterium]|jgi:polar amino acid transport system permease protein|nr:amino acid ABC transporter permease [Deltaproteobacteria bacterium]